MNVRVEKKNLWNAVKSKNAQAVENLYARVDEEYFKRLRSVEESGYEPVGWEAFQEFWGLVCSAVIDARRGFQTR